MIDYQTIVPVGAAVSAIGGAYLTVRKIAKDAANARKEHERDFLRLAKEEDTLMKAKLEARIEGIRAELKNLELSVNKDLGHMKDAYSSEMKNLGEKIELLREELRSQHSGILTLLSKLVNKKK